jgi:hypothetical protein
MERQVSRHVAIWIDVLQAVLLSFQTESSEKGIPDGPAEGWSQTIVNAQQYLLKQQYYNAVLYHLEPQDEILILGPCQAKRELRKLIERHDGLRGTVVGMYSASRLTKADLIFPTGEDWCIEHQDGALIAAVMPEPASGVRASLGGTR